MEYSQRLNRALPFCRGVLLVAAGLCLMVAGGRSGFGIEEASGQEWISDPYACPPPSGGWMGERLTGPPSVLNLTGLRPEFMPLEILYPSYLAGPREPRLGMQLTGEQDDGTLWDATIGGRFGWFRNVSYGGHRIWQVDVEGAALLRLDPETQVDLRSVDFRFGIPLTLAWGANRFKFGYEHLSSHLGDEFLIKNPTVTRDNYVREAIVAGYARYLTEKTRVYGEASWAFSRDVADPWHFQVGFEWAPTRPTGVLGHPYFAIHSLLREEVNYSGSTTGQVGWAWRDGHGARLIRTGLFYQTGKSPQGSFSEESETQVGAGLWYDF